MMLSLNDDKVDKLLQALQPQTRRTIAMWRHDKLGHLFSVTSSPLPKIDSTRQVERCVSIANASDDHRTVGATGAGSQQHYRVVKEEL